VSSDTAISYFYDINVLELLAPYTILRSKKTTCDRPLGIAELATIVAESLHYWRPQPLAVDSLGLLAKNASGS
jgi:hypothetical protein